MAPRPIASLTISFGLHHNLARLFEASGRVQHAIRHFNLYLRIAKRSVALDLHQPFCALACCNAAVSERSSKAPS
jgi:hypothetical protein